MEGAPLSSPEEELAYLRQQVAEKERALAALQEVAPQAEIVSERIVSHKKAPAEVLAPSYRMDSREAGNVAQRIQVELDSAEHERAVAGLIETMQSRGIKNALSVLEKLGDPHLEDDFHRYLVRYVAAGLPVAGAEERGPRFKALHMTLYQVALPEPKAEAAGAAHRPLKELLSAMEQFYAGLLATEQAGKEEPSYFALELAVPADKPELTFYVAVPNGKRDLFEKQLLAVFPNAQLSEQRSDYNIFVPQGASAGAEAALGASPALPLKDYTEFDYDPLNAITNAFAKIAHAGEGAALQVIVEPRGQRHTEHYKKILAALRKGEKRASAFSVRESALGEVAREFGKTLWSSKPKDEVRAREAETRQIEANKADIERVEKKISTSVAGVTIRLAASAKDQGRAGQILDELIAAFNQFGDTQGNRLTWTATRGKKAERLFDSFSFRLPSLGGLPLSLRELTTLYHFPPKGIESSPHLRQARFTSAPAPLSLPADGALLGVNRNRGQETKVYLADEDRLRHLYIVGQTGTGKTGLMKSLVLQDIRAGHGACFIDPHGNDVLDILAAIPPERAGDVIYFDPADLSRPFGLNMLEYDPARPEQKTFIVNEMLMIFRRLYGDVPEALGPAFEQYFRNATQLVMEDPASGSTLLDVPRVLSNERFRAEKLAKSRNPVINQFWQEIVSKVEGEASLGSITPYITNKFDDFIANDFMRPIIGQQESSFKFRDVIDNRKILLVNLSKGRLGEKNANLLGLIVVGKLFMAALSRSDSPREDFPPFYLYIDEFQNITTDSIPGILSEARKYRLALTMAHQFLAQVDEKVRNAIFGNVGSMAVFRVGEDDAEYFAKQFAPVFAALDFVNIENFNCYVKLLARGVPQKPFDIAVPRPPAGDPGQIDGLIKASSFTYGRDRASIESMIRERYLAPAA